MDYEDLIAGFIAGALSVLLILALFFAPAGDRCQRNLEQQKTLILLQQQRLARSVEIQARSAETFKLFGQFWAEHNDGTIEQCYRVAISHSVPELRDADTYETEAWLGGCLDAL